MQIGTKLFQVLFISLLLLIPLQNALAKPTPQRKYIKLEPIFDTSNVPKRSHFEVKITHTQMFEDPSVMLHGENRVIELGTEQKKEVLRARATEEQRDSTIDTLEYGVKPHFSVDLRKLTPKFAPDIARLLEAELAAAPRRIAGEVARQEQLLERALHPQQPKLAMPQSPLPARVDAAPQKALQAKLAQSKQHEQEDSQHAKQQLEAALSNAQKQNGKIPVMAGIPCAIPTNKLVKVSISLPLPPSVSTSTPEQQMADQLVKARLQLPPQSELDTQIALARKQAEASVSHAQPAMDAIMTNLRSVPNIDTKTAATLSTPDVSAELDTSSIIKWDEWHARFAQLARDPILNAVAKSGNPSGANTVQITVRRNHQLAVLLTQPGNAAFDRAIVQAYQSLDGSAALEYPTGSRRNLITFLIDNKHIGTGVPLGVKSLTSVGDREILRTHR